MDTLDAHTPAPSNHLGTPTRRVANTKETIFATITGLAAQHNAANLGQGFPDEDGPEQMLRIAAENITGSATTAPNNQYAPGRGVPELREAVARDRARRYGQHFDPQTEVLITVGATEGLAAAVLGVVERGRGVVVLDPAFDAYPAIAELAEAKLTRVSLRREGKGWALDRERFREAVTENTAAILLNSPHNPTGVVLGREDLEFIADTVRGTDTLVITDEVYERLVFDGEHVPFGCLDGMRERTVTISSASKNFNVTGWKTGWVCAPEPLLRPILAAKQFLTFTGATPLQPAVAWALYNADEWSARWRETLAARRDKLSRALTEVGFDVLDSAGTYFLVTDVASVAPGKNADEFCMELPRTAGVAAIPMTAFVGDPEDPAMATLVRWTFCKNDATLQQAIDRLTQWFS